MPLFVYFRLYHITLFNKLMKALIMCLGLEPGAAGWKAQTNPLSYVRHLFNLWHLIL